MTADLPHVCGLECAIVCLDKVLESGALERARELVAAEGLRVTVIESGLIPNDMIYLFSLDHQHRIVGSAIVVQ